MAKVKSKAERKQRLLRVVSLALAFLMVGSVVFAAVLSRVF